MSLVYGWVFYFVFVQGSSVVVILLPAGVAVVFLVAVGKGDAITTDLAKLNSRKFSAKS